MHCTCCQHLASRYGWRKVQGIWQERQWPFGILVEASVMNCWILSAARWHFMTLLNYSHLQNFRSRSQKCIEIRRESWDTAEIRLLIHQGSPWFSYLIAVFSLWNFLTPWVTSGSVIRTSQPKWMMKHRLSCFRVVNSEEPDELNLVAVDDFCGYFLVTFKAWDSIKLSGMNTKDFLGP